MSIKMLMKSWLVFVVLLGVLIMASSCEGNNNSSVSRVSSEEASSNNDSKPMIIWYHNTSAKSHKLYMLDQALSSGIITHVIIKHLNPLDAPLVRLKKTRQAIEICRKHQVEVIWARTLWPSYEIKSFRRSDMFASEYYENIIMAIKSEANTLGVSMTAIDTEPYALFPFKDIKKKRLTAEEYSAMKTAVLSAVQECGQLDFVAPSGGSFPYHMYEPLKNLGRLKISEHTYFDISKKLKDTKRTYDVFGAYVNVTKHNEQRPNAPYFTPYEILVQRSELWEKKKMLYMSANHKDMGKVSEMLSRMKGLKVGGRN